MTEKRLIIDGLELTYQGLFDIDALLKTIDAVTADRGYVKYEKGRAEIVKPAGKEFSIELRPVKRKTDYFALMIKIRIDITSMKDVEVLKDNVRTRLNEGAIHMLFDAWTTTDYEWRWEQKPLFYFLRNLVDRFIYKFHADRYTDELADDCHFIHKNVKAHLNLHEFY